MGPCSEDPHLCWASRLLGFTSLLLSVCWPGVKSSGTHGSGVQDSGVHVPLHRVRGGSVSFNVTRKQEAHLEEVTWGFGPDSNYRVLLRVGAEADAPTWVSLQDKYQQRVHVPSILSLKIENLTSEDSGLYRARASFTGGIERNQVFPLTVYEPVPLPQILFKLLSITPGWCNVTLECRASGATEDLKVTWQSKGLPRELEQSVTLGPAPNSWTLPVNLPLRQPSASFTCVVSNQVDQKTATLDLGEVCVHGECTCQRGGAFSELSCTGVRVLGFSPHYVMSTTFHRVTPYRSLGGTENSSLLLIVTSMPASPPPLFSPKKQGICFSVFWGFFCVWYAGLSLLRPLPLRSTGSGRAGSAAMAHGPSRSAACEIFPDRGTNPCPLRRQADSQPPRHQGSSGICF
ncbi:uncharacterized protein LOC105748826 isoform X2 [Orcinus orca]|nr:uncharacterized protein LOC105748826 isoform X2 [Orcinus orca]XP_049550519.1 uncharacterized protein LOC105748826 isoform X2 [Orcinus orca]